MDTVGTRELKQNPNAVIQRVLQTGQDLEITAHGHPTGTKIVAVAARGRWVPAGALAHITPMRPDNARAFADDVDRMREDDGPRDPWDDAT